MADGLPPDRFDPIHVFLATFSIASFAGLAALLRSGKELTLRSVMSAMLNSGLMGLAIAFVWYQYFAHDNIWFLMGISLLAGLGGMTVVDFVLEVFRRGGVDIHIKHRDEDD